MQRRKKKRKRKSRHLQKSQMKRTNRGASKASCLQSVVGGLSGRSPKVWRGRLKHLALDKEQVQLTSLAGVPIPRCPNTVCSSAARKLVARRAAFACDAVVRRGSSMGRRWAQRPRRSLVGHGARGRPGLCPTLRGLQQGEPGGGWDAEHRGVLLGAMRPQRASKVCFRGPEASRFLRPLDGLRAVKLPRCCPLTLISATKKRPFRPAGERRSPCVA